MAVACSESPEAAKQRHFQKGNAYVAQKQYAEAILEYRNALKIDTKFGEARFKLAEAYAANNDMRNAYGEYIRAADLSPDNEDAQIKTGNLMLVAGRFADARLRARVVLERNPKSLPGLMLLGNALAGLRDLENAVAVTERAIQVAPERSGTYTNLGALAPGQRRRHAGRGGISQGRRARARPMSRRAWRLRISSIGRSVTAKPPRSSIAS